MGSDAAAVFDAGASFAGSDAEREAVVAAYFGSRDLQGKRVLDAGCHAGGYAAVFERRGAVPYGVDLSPDGIEKAKRDHPGLRDNFHLASVCELGMFPDGFFDLVFCFGVMPYLDADETRRALAEFSRVTKAGGEMLLVFQRDKSAPVRLFTKAVNCVPLPAYKALVPVLALLCVPVAPLLIGRRASYSYLRHGVFLSLRGIHYGVPAGLEPHRVPTPDCGPVSPGTSESFLVRKAA